MEMDDDEVDANAPGTASRGRQFPELIEAIGMYSVGICVCLGAIVLLVQFVKWASSYLSF